MEEAVEKPTALSKLKRFYLESRRVLTVTKKPTKDEFKIIVKVSGLGILAIGFVGFLISAIKQFLL